MIKCYSCGKYGHYVVEWCNMECSEEANLTFMDDEEPKLMLAKKMPNLLMLNKEKVMTNILAHGEDQMKTIIWCLDNEVSNHMTGDREKFKKL